MNDDLANALEQLSTKLDEQTQKLNTIETRLQQQQPPTRPPTSPVSINVHTTHGTSQFAIGECLLSLSVPDNVFQVISKSDTDRDGLWYKCHVLNRLDHGLSHPVSTIVKEVGLEREQLVVWTNRQVDMQHSNDLRPALLVNRLNHFRSQFRTGESNKFFLVGVYNPDTKVVETVQPGATHGHCVAANVSVPTPELPVTTRTFAMTSARVVFLQELHRCMRSVVRQDTPARFVAKYSFPLSPREWHEGFQTPLADYGVSMRFIETLETKEYMDGLKCKKQVVTIKATQFHTESQNQVEAIKSVFGRNSLSYFMSAEEVAIAEFRNGSGVRISYFPPPLAYVDVQLSMSRFQIRRSPNNRKSMNAAILTSKSSGSGSSSLSPARRRSEGQSRRSMPSMVQLQTQFDDDDTNTIFTDDASVATSHRTVVRASGVNRTQTKWNKEEHARFINAMRLHGQGEWIKIAESVGTRDAAQVKDHAKKYLRLVNGTNNGPSKRAL